MKKILLKLFIVFVVLCGVIAVFCPIQTYGYPSNAIVRVGIMDEKYTTVEKSSVTIYGTDKLVVLTPKKEEIFTLEGGKYLTVVRENNEYVLSYIDTETGETVENNIRHDFSVTCPNGVIGIKDFIRGGKPAMYRGEFKFTGAGNKSDKFYLVNYLDVEYYLKGVVPCEMPVSFGLEALKAQAVAAYSFSQANNTYEGQAYDSSFRYSGSDVEKAVMAVLNMTSKSDTPKAMCCYYSGKPANTVYFASSAGKTTSAESVWGGYIPYLNGGVSSPEQVPESQKTYTSEEMRALIQSWAASKGKSVTLGSDPSTWLVIKSHDSARGANCGYVTKISVGGVEIMGASFRSAVLNNGIRSHCFTITYIPD